MKFSFGECSVFRVPAIPWAVVAGLLASVAIAVGQQSDAPDEPPADTAATAAETTSETGPPGTSTDENSLLPWKRSNRAAPQLPTKRKSSPREMLALLNVGSSEIDQLIDDRPFLPDEQETLIKILYRIPRFGQEKLEDWARTDAELGDAAADPADFRTEIFRIDGRATRLVPKSLPDEIAKRFEFNSYFEVHIDPQDSDHPVVLYCRSVPQAWLDQSSLNERCRCYGLFLKAGEASDSEPTLYFAAERIAWLPHEVDPATGVTKSLAQLGKMGVDVGLLDQVRKHNRKAIVAEDRELFYQMLAALRAADADQLKPHAEGGFELQPMLTEPQSQQGRLVAFDGIARRVTRIAVGDEDIQSRFGIDHYYQIDVFVPLGDQEVRLGQSREDEPAPVFRNSYPVHCCVLELPPGLPAEPDISQRVAITGFYFKLWSYGTEFVRAYDDRQRQVGPMFIAATPQLRQPPKSSFDENLGLIVGLAFLAALGGLLIGGWIYRRSDKNFERKVLRHQFEVKEGQSLNSMGIEARDGPDFSGLNESDEKS